MANTGRFDRHAAGASLVHALGKGLDLKAGYRYSVALYEGSNDSQGHVIDAGVNYNRALSFSRRTSFSFSTGTTASQTAPDGSLRYWATGAARLYHEIGRTWTAILSYDRGLQFTENWLEPLFTDSASAGLRGSINRRVYAHLEARAMRGVGQQDLDDGLVTYSASAGLTYAVTRYVNSGINYTYYNHEFGSDVSLPLGYAHDFNRRSIRAYVSVWAPLFERSRRP